MCQARPGTRCSGDARQTLAHAESEYRNAESNSFAAKQMDLPEEQQVNARRTLKRAYVNLAKATRQWNETPEGIQALRDGGDEKSATMFSQAREYRRQSLEIIESDRHGSITRLPTKGIASSSVEFEEGTNVFTAVVRTENASTGEFDTVSTRGIYETNTTMDGYVYKSPELGAVYIKTTHPKSNTSTMQVQSAMNDKYAKEHTFVDRKNSYLQAKSRYRDAMEETLIRDSNYAEAYRDASIDYAEVSALRSASQKDPDNVKLQSQLSEAEEQYATSKAKSQSAYYAKVRAEGAEEAAKKMEHAMLVSGNRADVIRELSKMEPNPHPQKEDVAYHVEGFERQRRNFLKEAVNFTW